MMLQTEDLYSPSLRLKCRCLSFHRRYSLFAETCVSHRDSGIDVFVRLFEYANPATRDYGEIHIHDFFIWRMTKVLVSKVLNNQTPGISSSLSHICLQLVRKLNKMSILFITYEFTSKFRKPISSAANN